MKVKYVYFFMGKERGGGERNYSRISFLVVVFYKIGFFMMENWMIEVIFYVVYIFFSF